MGIMETPTMTLLHLNRSPRLWLLRSCRSTEMLPQERKKAKFPETSYELSLRTKSPGVHQGKGLDLHALRGKRVKVAEQLDLWSLKNALVLSSAWNKSSFSDFIMDQVTLQRGILSLQETSWSYDFFLTFCFFFFKLIKAIWSLGTWKERVIYSMSLWIKE